MTSQIDSHSLANAMLEQLRSDYNGDEVAFYEENDSDELFDQFYFWLEDGHGDGVTDSTVLLAMWELF